MSGIFTVFSPNARQITENVFGALEQSPMDSGFVITDNVALGYTVPKEPNAPLIPQPLANEDETIWITFDGDIYNKGQLLQQMAKSHKLHEYSSAEVVVHAYESSGFNCLSEFNGIFTFCLWDSKNGLLFSARDRLGMKSLYYYRCPEKLVIASELKGILCDPSVPREPNDRVIYEYLVTGYPSQIENTFLLEIKELSPANYMIVQKNGIEIQRYWHPIKSVRSNKTKKDDNWYASEFRQLLQDSITMRLPEEFPVGTLVSGGLDSTSIAFLIDDILKSSAKYQQPHPHEIFSAIYAKPTEQGDERRYIQHVAPLLQTGVNYVFPTVTGGWNDIKRFIHHIEEPVAVFNYYVFWHLFKTAKKKVKIVFSGQGSDAMLGGQSEHVQIYFKELWETKKIGKLVKELIMSLDWILPSLVWSILFRKKTESNVKLLLAPKFMSKYTSDKVRKEPASLKCALLYDITQHAIEYLRVDDRASAAFSVVCRHPFLDHRIVEFAFCLPATQKIRNGWTKHVLRNAMKGFIPEAIRRNRKKAGTPIPQQRWMRELQQSIRQLFLSEEFVNRKYFNQTGILEVFDRYCQGRLNRIEQNFYANVLWRIINLELWLETFVD